MARTWHGGNFIWILDLQKNDDFLVAFETKPFENGYSSYEFRSYYWHWTVVMFLATRRQFVWAFDGC